MENRGRRTAAIRCFCARYVPIAVEKIIIAIISLSLSLSFHLLLEFFFLLFVSRSHSGWWKIKIFTISNLSAHWSNSLLVEMICTFLRLQHEFSPLGIVRALYVVYIYRFSGFVMRSLSFDIHIYIYFMALLKWENGYILMQTKNGCTAIDFGEISSDYHFKRNRVNFSILFSIVNSVVSVCCFRFFLGASTVDTLLPSDSR